MGLGLSCRRTRGGAGRAGRCHRSTRGSHAMRVAFMARSLRGTMSGVARYADGLARAWAPLLGSDLSVFVTQADDGLADLPVRRVRAPFKTPNEYARALWEQTVVPPQVRQLRA